ncbi:hypothetical protein [Pontibacter harenae]|uniref:hypothetical protein n=1 Tax=Pontibacter harenae TaxID=2894083 RepID=UPI001E2C3B73|nr:hypothetical protein [Pontibacter harenae]MCC9166790.1 hypothetical protein [Pontibacter harenae]
MKKLLYLLSLSFLSLFLLTSCEKEDESCSGLLPTFTAEELAWLPGKTEEDKITYISSTGESKIYYELHSELYTAYEDGRISEIPCPSTLTIYQDYFLSDNPYFRLPADPAQTKLFIQIKKSQKKGFVTSFYWKQLNLQKLFSQFPEQLNELKVRGNTYSNVYVYTNDISHADDFEGPTTHKLYFAKDFGLVKWENADGEVWERQQ